jgi:hypothetical protein
VRIVLLHDSRDEAVGVVYELVDAEQIALAVGHEALLAEMNGCEPV